MTIIIIILRVAPHSITPIGRIHVSSAEFASLTANGIFDAFVPV